MPEIYLQIMETWKKHLPDYEFRLWDSNALEEANLTFANEAVSVRKWAFAADAIRIYAVYHYGGIWLDGDAVVLKTFDPYLDCRMFIGKEHHAEFSLSQLKHRFVLGAHCFGAEKGHPFLKDCLEYYYSNHFVVCSDESLPQDIRYNMRILPSILACLATKYGYIGNITHPEQVEVLSDDIRVYQPWIFDSSKYHNGKDLVCMHLKLHSWGTSPRDISGLLLKDIQIEPQKKDLYYYIFTVANKLLAKRGFQIGLKSI